MDVGNFKDLFYSMSRISQLTIQLWNRGGLVFSTDSNKMSETLSCEIGVFSTSVIRSAEFRHTYLNSQEHIFGVPIMIEDEIAGALLAYRTNPVRGLTLNELDSQKIINTKDMETFLASLSNAMEDKWGTEKEMENITEELSLCFEDLYLYSMVGTQIKSLRLSGSMQKNLAKDILTSMRVDLAFLVMPERGEEPLIVGDQIDELGIPDVEVFVDGLLAAIPLDAPVLEENYFLVYDSRDLVEYAKLSASPFRFLTVKIKYEDNFYGWLGIVSFNFNETFRRGELRLMISMAEQLAVVITNGDLYDDLENFIINMIKSLVNAIEAKDLYTRGHSERVSSLCMLMACCIDMKKEDKENLQWASILHDVGKIGVPEAILNKQGPLDDEEYKIIKEHPERGYKILQPIGHLKGAVEGIRYHHESYDGSGYPCGLKGEEIPLFARIIAVVDTYDAITSKRPYRDAGAAQKGLRIVNEIAGKQLDPHLVSVFNEICNEISEIGETENPVLGLMAEKQENVVS